MDNNNLPTHIAIIMDGNGRWAKKRGLPRNMGHRKGSETLMKAIKYANQKGIKYLTVYAFSSENWNRPQSEVDYLMKLPFEFLNKFDKNFGKENIKIKVIGRRDKLSMELINKIKEIETKTINNTGLTFIIALNYGSQDELIDAINEISKQNITVTKESFNNYLYTKDIPDVDLMIRTSGEYRLSNFLLWQLAYSELYFTDILWPDFNQKCFDEALVNYSKRERRFGGLK
jgi:undecaprenyl diphosphate synthase